MVARDRAAARQRRGDGRAIGNALAGDLHFARPLSGTWPRRECAADHARTGKGLPRRGRASVSVPAVPEGSDQPGLAAGRGTGTAVFQRSLVRLGRLIDWRDPERALTGNFRGGNFPSWPNQDAGNWPDAASQAMTRRRSRTRRSGQCQGLARSHHKALLVAVSRTASGTSAASICPSLPRSNAVAAARVPSGPMSSTNASGGTPAGYRAYTEP